MNTPAHKEGSERVSATNRPITEEEPAVPLYKLSTKDLITLALDPATPHQQRKMAWTILRMRNVQVPR